MVAFAEPGRRLEEKYSISVLAFLPPSVPTIARLTDDDFSIMSTRDLIEVVERSHCIRITPERSVKFRFYRRDRLLRLAQFVRWRCRQECGLP